MFTQGAPSDSQFFFSFFEIYRAVIRKTVFNLLPFHPRQYDHRDLFGGFEHFLGQIESEQVDEIVFADAMGVARADEPGLDVGDLDFGTQDVEAFRGAGIEPARGVLDFRLPQIHGGLLDDDLLRGEKHVVVGHTLPLNSLLQFAPRSVLLKSPIPFHAYRVLVFGSISRP